MTEAGTGAGSVLGTWGSAGCGLWDYCAGVGQFHEQRRIVDASDVESALHAAAVLGDDRLQKMATGRVSPEMFTHGTSAKRVGWFRRGFDSGRISACNTFKEEH